MTDYTKTSGETGKMMIRDLGSTVEFWFKAGHTSNYWYDMPFNWTANGVTTSKTIDYPTGADWKKVGSVVVSTSQTVTFRLTGSSGTGGMGGPTTFSQYLNRSTAPSAPSTPVISGITTTSAYVTFNDGANGGLAIDARQIGYGLSASAMTIVSSDRSTTITGLTPGKTYYFWARTHNAKGWSGWSARAQATTLKVPDPPTTPLLSSVRATSVDVAFTPNGNGGSPITGYEIGYGTSPTTPSSTVATASSPKLVTGLNPGTVYYFFTRAKSAVGYSAWSAPSSARTIAGAYIKVGAVWKLAVPYVRVGGVWQVAEPWVRSAGVWKRTT